MQVFCLYITGHLEKVFDEEHRKEMLRHVYCHQVNFTKHELWI